MQGFGSIYSKNLELFYLLVTCQALGIYSENPAELLEKLGITYSEAQLQQGIPAGHFTKYKDGVNNSVKYARSATHRRGSTIYPNEYWGIGLIKFDDGLPGPHNVVQKFNNYVDLAIDNYWLRTFQAEERVDREVVQDYLNYISKV
jgi:hypothetical protein